MALPPAIQTCVISFGPFLTFMGVPFAGVVTFTPSRALVWTATGTPILPSPIPVTLDENGTGSISLPLTSQSGFSDGSGNAVTNWTYNAAVALTGRTVDTRTFQVPTTTPIDLDLTTPVPSSQGIVVALPEVISVAGFTGAVTVEQLEGVLPGGGLPSDADLDDIDDSATRVAMLPAERTKLGDLPTSSSLTASLAAKAPLASPTFSGTVSGVTKTHVGLGNVDNTTDAAKPVSTATQTALDAKAPLASPAFTGTPTGITKTHVGLANVDNTTDAAKPVSTAQATAIALKAPIASPTFTGTVSGITKAMVGLSNVDNTADSAKPVSTAQAAAIAAAVVPSNDDDNMIVTGIDGKLHVNGAALQPAGTYLGPSALDYSPRIWVLEAAEDETDVPVGFPVSSGTRWSIIMRKQA